MLWPPKYYKGLSNKNKTLRRSEIVNRSKLSWKTAKAYRPFKTDKGVKTRKSSYSSRWHSKHPEAKSLSEIAKASGVSESTLKTVYNRGMAAWRTGHRPGASEHAWGMARVHSFVLHGKTWRTADSDLH
jgi:DNA invertase Pin-like site-specific DNA recombinase